MASPLSPRTRALILLVDRISIHVARHWLALAFSFFALFSGLPFVAPIAQEYGYQGVSDAIYWIYSLTCHQLAYRSFFLFGPQSAYSVDDLQHALNVSYPLTDVLAWREFRGNAELGYKMAFCERDAAIYMTMALAAIIFAFIRSRVRALPFRWYLVLLLPMAIDGTWQLISTIAMVTPIADTFPLHESTPLLRTVTGALFGLGTAWLTLPIFNQAMQDLERDAGRQLARAQSTEP